VAPPQIAIVSATYGRACGPTAIGNRTELVGRECNGKAACSYLVNNAAGDPFPGCAKDFDVEYRCHACAGTTKVTHAAAKDENYKVNLPCN
jgi:hypothetical protein